jgi:hypothetical protein
LYNAIYNPIGIAVVFTHLVMMDLWNPSIQILAIKKNLPFISLI